MNSKADYDDVRPLFTQIVKAVSTRFLNDAEFRKRMFKDPEGTLRAEGMDTLNDFIAKLKSADPEAIEAGIASGETNPSC